MGDQALAARSFLIAPATPFFVTPAVGRVEL
jgi:hypothetical protein